MSAQLRRRLLLVLDSVATAPLKRKTPIIQHVAKLLRPSTRKFARVALLVGLVDRIIPGTSRLLSKLFLMPDKLPFDCSSIRVLGWGSGCTVFLLQDANRRLVLKAYRDTVGVPHEEKLAFVQTNNMAFQSVVSQFANYPDIILPTHFLLIHGPILGQPVAAAFQELVEGDTRDLHDYLDAELGELLMRDNKLRGQFAFLVQNVSKALSDGGFVIDVLGRENLMVIKEEDQHRLLLLDPEMMNSAEMRHFEPKKYARYLEYVERLRDALRWAEVNKSIYEDLGDYSVTTRVSGD